MFQDLLRKYRVKQGLKQSDLAEKINEKLGVKTTYANVSSWESGTNPKIEVIEAISQILKIPVQYLFDDTDATIHKIISDKMPSVKDMSENTLKIQLYDGLCGAGCGGILYNTTNDFIYIDNSFLQEKYKDKVIIAFKIVGDSMTPYLSENDIVLVNIISEFDTKPTIDGKYLINTNAGTMLKNLSFISDGSIIVSTTNKSYPNEIIKKGESSNNFEIIGVALGSLFRN